MKKLILLLFLGMASAYAQDVSSADNEYVTAEKPATAIPNKLLTAKDFKLSEGRMACSDRPCQIVNGNSTDKFLVSVLCKQAAFKATGVERINQMIEFANKKVQNTIAIDQKYLAKEIRMSFNPESKNWSLTNLFSIKSENGDVKSTLLSLDFDADGKFKVMKRVF